MDILILNCYFLDILSLLSFDRYACQKLWKSKSNSNVRSKIENYMNINFCFCLTLFLTSEIINYPILTCFLCNISGDNVTKIIKMSVLFMVRFF